MIRSFHSRRGSRCILDPRQFCIRKNAAAGAGRESRPLRCLQVKPEPAM